MTDLTDWQLVELYLEQCLEFINPKIFNTVVDRGLYNIINKLPKDREDAHMVAMHRMVKNNKALGLGVDEFLLRDRMSRIKTLKEEIFNTPDSDISDLRNKCLTLINFING